jgi:lactate dehydrogenase-like 2-hydroxyacid dehydrogenase
MFDHLLDPLCCCVPTGVLTETTAEIAAALTFAAARRVVEADSFMRNGHYKGWLPTLFIGNLLQNKTVRVPTLSYQRRFKGGPQ